MKKKKKIIKKLRTSNHWLANLPQKCLEFDIKLFEFGLTQAHSQGFDDAIPVVKHVLINQSQRCFRYLPGDLGLHRFQPFAIGEGLFS